MGQWHDFEANGGPVFAAEGRHCGRLAGRPLPISFIEDWRSECIVPGDCRCGAGEAYGAMELKCCPEVLARWGPCPEGVVGPHGASGSEGSLYVRLAMCSVPLFCKARQCCPDGLLWGGEASKEMPSSSWGMHRCSVQRRRKDESAETHVCAFKVEA